MLEFQAAGRSREPSPAAGHLSPGTTIKLPGLPMMPRPSGAALASCYEDMPLSLVLFRYLWPFWLFKDASRGDRLARAAAYRHNRSMRIYLPGYLMKWM